MILNQHWTYCRSTNVRSFLLSASFTGYDHQRYWWKWTGKAYTFYTICSHRTIRTHLLHIFYQLNHQSSDYSALIFHIMSIGFCLLASLFRSFAKRPLKEFLKRVSLKRVSPKSISLAKDLFEKNLSFKEDSFTFSLSLSLSLSLSKTIRTQFHTTWLFPARTLASDRATKHHQRF